MTEIRNATTADASQIAEIYAHHVLHGTATFDTIPPTVEFWQAKIAAISGLGSPFLVADQAGDIIGYAYATQFRDRPAYRETCENSVYVSPDNLGAGVGTLLMNALASEAQACGFREMIAVIGGAEPASVALHRKCGFSEAGRMKNVGRKFGRLLDTLYMQKNLNS